MALLRAAHHNYELVDFIEEINYPLTLVMNLLGVIVTSFVIPREAMTIMLVLMVVRHGIGRELNPLVASLAQDWGIELGTGMDYLRTTAIARLVLDNIENLQVSYVTQGPKMAQIALGAGAAAAPLAWSLPLPVA